MTPLGADEVTLISGIRLHGRVLRASDTELVFESDDGRRVRLPRTKVARMTLARPETLRLADDLYAAGRFMTAADAYERAVKVLGVGLQRHRARKRLVQCLVVGGRERRAVEVLVDLLVEHPGSPGAAGLPLFGMNLSDPAGVAAVLEKRERDIGDERVLLIVKALGCWAYLSKGDIGSAAGLVEELAKADHPDARSLGILCEGWKRYQDGQAAEAVQQVEGARAGLTALARPHAALLLARGYASLGRHGDACLAALRLAFAYDEHPHLAAEGLYLAGRSLVALKELPNALMMFERLAASYPASRRAPEARRQVEALEQRLAGRTGAAAVSGATSP